MEEKISGKVVDIRYTSFDGEYTVATVRLGDKSEVVVTGPIAAVDIGDNIEITGEYVTHRIYGEQFKVNSFIPLKPDDEQGIYEFLASGVIEGIGEKFARRIMQVFGDKTLDIIEKTPERLLEIEGIGSKKLDKIITSYNEKMMLKNIIIQLAKYDLSTTLSIKIYNTYNENTLKILSNNPYRLCDDIKGIGFKKADEIAKKMGVALDSTERKIQAIIYSLTQSTYEGHTYTTFFKLKSDMKELIDFDDEDEILSIAYDLYAKKQIIIDGIEKDDMKIFLYRYALAETTVASKLIELATYQDKKIDEKKLDELIQEQIKYSNIDFSQEQIKSVKMAVNNNILIITGGPGTGKTTTLSFIIEIFERIGKKVKLCAPTGKASKRMAQATNKDASTIHRLLEMNYSSDDMQEHFLKNEDEPIKADVIIVDETSMVDILLMQSLLLAIKNGTHLILVGDKDQLPSVGAGNVLKDIINCEIIPCIKLNKIFRQAMKSHIIVNAHRINEGKMPLTNDKDNDFFIMNRNDKNSIEKLIVELITQRLPKYYDITPKDIQIITPMKKREIGTQNLNKLLQEALNPKDPVKNEYKTQFKIYRENDRVIHIKNNYEKQWISDKEEGSGVFNGDTGTIESVNLREKFLTVNFDDGKKATYDFDELDELEHSFALTVHKSQGSEYPCVILPIHSVAPMLMTRKILYTAITRAKKLLIIISSNSNIKKMVDNIYEEERNSTLMQKLKMFKDYKMLD
ncbi:RecD/TraA family helicase [Peptoanaerobacter stomatis]|uniref:ATP-dependent RecD2 DNA helicase n=1 Tax=Peptoanaerobacter stomatis TaxID=796937 RepID=V9HV08_9FIRM|nr:ATP-dependent RecD-like DNA helicase [Peptoanaerobacter stomatis]EHL18139.1 RecD/TraA family helicase [Peptoanaerobacter stomatis]